MWCFSINFKFFINLRVRQEAIGTHTGVRKKYVFNSFFMAQGGL